MFFLFLFLAEVTVLVLDSLLNFFLIVSALDLLCCMFNSDKIADSWQGP